MKRTSAPSPYTKRQKTGPPAPVQAKTFFKKSDAGLPELKFIDTTKAATAVATAGTIFNSSLLLMQEGTSDSTRIGNKITVKSVMLRGSVFANAQVDANETSNVVRIIVYLDRQANGATAAVTDILASANWRSFNNLDNKDRFRTLAEKEIAIVLPGATPSGAAFVFGETVQPFFMKAKLNMVVKYKLNVGDITDLASANIGVLVIAKDTLGSVDYIARCKYTDM